MTGETMKAALYHRYGGPEVVRIEQVPRPVPRKGEVLIAVHSSTVTTADWRARTLAMPPGFGPFGRLAFGLTGPRQPILGTELSGTVAATGPGVSHFSAGDPVVAFAGVGLACHAEYRAFPQDGAIIRKPEALSFEEAAAVSFAGTTALHFLRDKANVQPGERVLINGAAGAVGSSAVQLARHFGAEVTGVCGAGNADLVRGLGAAHVIDYARSDFATTGQRYDVIMDMVGNVPWARARGALTRTGRLVAVLGGLGAQLRAPLVSRRNGKRMIAGVAPETRAHMQTLAGLAEAGAFRPVIDSVYPLDDIGAAHARVETGHKTGSVVVRIGGPG